MAVPIPCSNGNELRAVVGTDVARSAAHDEQVGQHIDALLVGQTVTLRYDPQAPPCRPIQVVHDAKPAGKATRLDAYANTAVKRHRPSWQLQCDHPPPEPPPLSAAMRDVFVVATDGEALVGVAGLEVYGSNSLLRSLAVDEEHRSRGLGARLVDAIEAEARSRGVTALYLLTTTAAGFFERLGYTAHERAAVPDSIAATAEFSSLCPGTAHCLWRDLST